MGKNTILWEITIFNGKTHYFDWAIFNSYVNVYQRVSFIASVDSLPEIVIINFADQWLPIIANLLCKSFDPKHFMTIHDSSSW